jgi:hypothetical protein
MTIAHNNFDVGIELEYPTSQDWETSFSERASDSCDMYDEVDADFLHWPEGGDITYDGTVGLELTSNQISIAEAPDWYRASLYELEKYEPHEPTGMMVNGSRGSTAGLHIHFSSATREEAETLARLSREPYMQVFACSSITDQDQRVFRDNYCNIDEFDSQRYSVVHSCRGDGHWEWRMPEPMTGEHFGLLMEFLDRFSEDMYDAAQWAKELVESGDERITAIKRADEVGLKEVRFDQNDYFDWDVRRGSISSVPSLSEAYDFADSVRYDTHSPYIYTVTDPQDRHFYVFWTRNYSEDETFGAEGIEYDLNTVFRVYEDGTMTPSRALDPEVGRAAIEEYRDQQNRSTRKTEATKKLADVLEVQE